MTLHWLVLGVLGAVIGLGLPRLVQALPHAILASEAGEAPSGSPPLNGSARLGLGALNAVLWAGCGWHWTSLASASCWAVFGSVLLTLSVIDWRTGLLPDALTQPLVWAGLLASASHQLNLSLDLAVWGAVAGYGSLWLVATGFKAVTGKDGMGGGDFKLLAALGAWLGPLALIPLVLLASVAGAALGLWLQARDRLPHDGYVPFGPFLAVAGMVLAVLGPDPFLLRLWA